MSRFDSPSQVILLFVLATFVSVLLIFLINAENNKRYARVVQTDNNHQTANLTNTTTTTTREWSPHGVAHYLRGKVLSLLGFLKSRLTTIMHNPPPPEVETKERRKRSVVGSDKQEVILMTRRTRHNHGGGGGGSGNKHLTETEGVRKVRQGEEGEVCYRTDDVLLVVGITCCLNFTFVCGIWAVVRLCTQLNRHPRFHTRKRHKYKDTRGGRERLWEGGEWSSSSGSSDSESEGDVRRKRVSQSMEELRYVT